MNIILVGNPNVGKSVIFNALTGSYVTVSNYPGTTVDITKGIVSLGNKKFSVIDTPGVNSLIPHSEDENVTKDILSKSDISCVVQVADSKNLIRSLVLTLELMELNLPLVLNLNMSDEAKERGIKIDTKKLSQKLGIEIVETVATTGEGIHKLKEAILRAKVPHPSIDISVTEKIIGRAESALLGERNQIATSLAEDVMRGLKPLKKNTAEIISQIAIRPFTGIPLLMLIMFIMYLFVGKFAAGTGVDFFLKIRFSEKSSIHFL